MISYALVMFISLSTGQMTQALLEGPMSSSWCEQLIRQDRYIGEDGGTRKRPLCLSGQVVQQVLAASDCTRAPGPSPRWPAIRYECAALQAAAATVAGMTDAQPPAPPDPAPDTDAADGASGAGTEVITDAPVQAPDTAPESPQPSAPEAPAPVHRQFHLGPAAASLVTQAQSESGSGHHVTAAATLERALRIEQGNPLLWIELGRVRMAAGQAAQAEGMYRKALALAAGDSDADSRAWHLIAESLRARGRNQEAAEADSHVPPAAAY